MSGYEGFSLMALSIAGQGDISGSNLVLWSHDRGTPYIPSPLLYDGLLFFTQSNQAILSCVDARTGELVFQRERLQDFQNIYASPVGASGRVYLAGAQWDHGRCRAVHRVSDTGRKLAQRAIRQFSSDCRSPDVLAWRSIPVLHRRLGRLMPGERCVLDPANKTSELTQTIEDS